LEGGIGWGRVIGKEREEFATGGTGFNNKDEGGEKETKHFSPEEKLREEEW